MTTATPSTPTKLAYNVVPMQNDFDSLLATIATVTGKSSPADIKKVAVEKHLLPAHGPYWSGDDVMIAKVFAALGWVSTVWKEAEDRACPNFCVNGFQVKAGRYARRTRW